MVLRPCACQVHVCDVHAGPGICSQVSNIFVIFNAWPPPNNKQFRAFPAHCGLPDGPECVPKHSTCGPILRTPPVGHSNFSRVSYNSF